MAKKKRDLKSLLIPKLREASRYWPPKKRARDNAKVQIELGAFKNGNTKTGIKYKCAKCADLFNKEETQMDHKQPVIQPEVGFVDWNTYIDRLFVEENFYQLLCRGCHKQKSAKENAKRRKLKKKLDI